MENEDKIEEIRQRIMDATASPRSEEGQAAIQNAGTHIAQIWQDGEVTSTKAGDLYGHRSIHPSTKPFLDRENHLWEVEEGVNKCRVVTNPDAKDALKEYKEMYPTWVMTYEVKVRVNHAKNRGQAVERAKEQLKDAQDEGVLHFQFRSPEIEQVEE